MEDMESEESVDEEGTGSSEENGDTKDTKGKRKAVARGNKVCITHCLIPSLHTLTNNQATVAYTAGQEEQTESCYCRW